MPFESEAQRRKIGMLEAEGEVPKGTYAEFEAATPDNKKLPEHVKASALELRQLFSECKGAKERLQALRANPTTVAELSAAIDQYKTTRQSLVCARDALRQPPPAEPTPEPEPPKAQAHSSQWAMKTSTHQGQMTLLTTSHSASILADVLRGKWDGPDDSSTSV